MKVLVKVTKSILEKTKMCGRTLESMNKITENCAVAVVVREILDNAKVGYNTIIADGLEEFISIPFKGTEFIMKFDKLTPEERVEMEPISFEIDVPEEIIEKIGISQVEEILKNSETLELVEH